MQVIAACAFNILGAEQASLISDSLPSDNGRSGPCVKVVLVACTVNIYEQTCSLVLDCIGGLSLVNAVRQDVLTFSCIDLCTISSVSLCSSSEILGGSVLEDNLVGCGVSLLESLTACTQFSIGSHRINLELRSVEVSILRVVVVSSNRLVERIELDIAAAISTISLSHREAQMAECAAQVKSLAGCRSRGIGVRKLDVTDVGPCLCIVTTLYIHTCHVTISSITTAYINLDKTGYGLVECNLQIRNAAVSSAVVTVPVG